MVLMFLQSPAKDDVEGDIIVAFEFSHVIIFLSAMFFVMEAFFMMLINNQLKVKVDQSAAKTSREIVDEYKSRKAEGELTPSHFISSRLVSSEPV